MNHAFMERAWFILKGKEDAPNYRKATGPKNAEIVRLGTRQKLTTP